MKLKQRNYNPFMQEHLILSVSDGTSRFDDLWFLNFMILAYTKGSPNILFFFSFQLLEYSLGWVHTNLNKTED
jgi:hypothetical protein